MIVLLPGWAGIRTSMLPLEWRLRRRLADEVIRPDVGFGTGCIRELAEHAATQLERIANAHPGREFDVIGHSMGGLVATYVLKRLDHGRRLRSVITLGTPHRGSPAAIFMQRVVGRFSAALAQMTPRSEFVNELLAAPVPPNCRLVSIAAANDGLVPPLYAQLPRRARQHNRELAGLSHLGLLNSDVVVDVIGRLLQRMHATRPVSLLREHDFRRPSHAATSVSLGLDRLSRAGWTPPRAPSGVRSTGQTLVFPIEEACYAHAASENRERLEWRVH
jgi:pimeloyl-ACP methyl ester carboxylesterase